MTTPERKEARAHLVAVARDLGDRLERALREETAEVIPLSRPDAIVTIGLLAAAAEALEREAEER